MNNFALVNEKNNKNYYYCYFIVMNAKGAMGNQITDNVSKCVNDLKTIAITIATTIATTIIIGNGNVPGRIFQSKK